MNVKLIRMWSGEDVITDLVEEKEDSIVLRNPIVAIPTSSGKMGFAPWSPLLNGRDTDVEITRRYIVYIAETQDEVVEQYELMYSSIQTPSKKLIV